MASSEQAVLTFNEEGQTGFLKAKGAPWGCNAHV